MAGKLVFFGMILGIFAILNITQVFAINDDEIRATEKIKSNPAMMQILKKIEQSKKILAEMQEEGLLLLLEQTFLLVTY